MKASILIVDDEPFVLNSLGRLLQRSGYRIRKANGGEEALTLLAQDEAALIITDYRMPGMDGAQLLAEINQRWPTSIGIVLSGYADFQAVVNLLNSGHAYKFLQKPWVDLDLLQVVQEGVGIHQLRIQQQTSKLNLKPAALLQLDTNESLENGFTQRLIAFVDKHPDMSVVAIQFSHLIERFSGVDSAPSEQVTSKLRRALCTAVGEDAEVIQVHARHFYVLLPTMFTTEDISVLNSYIYQALNQEAVLKTGRYKAICYPYQLKLLAINEIMPTLNMHIEFIGSHERNHVHILDAERLHGLEGSVLLSQALTRALAAHELVVHLQPKFCMHTQRIHGVEALSRWYSQELGRQVSPAQFIQTAERDGQIIALGRWLIAHCCSVARSLNASSHMPIAINISGIQVSKDPHWVDFLLEQMALHTIASGAIEVEITETAVVANAAACIEQVRRLSEQAIKVWLDDFGAGVTSVSHLQQMQIHGIKLDKSLIDTIDSEWRSASIVRNLIQMAQDIGIKVVAEGVENVSQYRLLQNWGCDYVQGFLFAQPIEVEGFIQQVGLQHASGVYQCTP